MRRFPPISRRTLLAGSMIAVAQPLTARSLVAQTPVATPGADQIALYASQRAEVLEAGRAFIGALLARDDATFTSNLTPDVAAALATTTTAEFMEILETNRVDLHLEEPLLWMNGHLNDLAISGFAAQASAQAFILRTDAAQAGDAPTGTWTGTIAPGVVDQEVSVTFSGTADALEATLDIPDQGLAGVPFTRASFLPDVPIGELIDESVLAFGATARAYQARYAWGDAELDFMAVQDTRGLFGGFGVSGAIPLPEDPMAGHVSDVSYRLAADGELTVFWGGETTLQNYHVTVPVQRHACDLVRWQDGSTYRGDGMSVEDYYIWGVPMLSPAAGTVVAVENGLPDIAPAVAARTGALDVDEASPAATAPAHPAGNHVVIQAAEAEFVLLAHMQQGSVSVAVGDVLGPGDRVGLVGNSGNTSEPHIHIHLQNVPDMFDPAAVGLPLAFDHLLVDGKMVEQGQPVQGQFVEQV